MISARNICLLIIAWVLTCGCRRDMFTQPKANPLRESTFFANGSSARPIPPNTVSREDLQHQPSYYSGMTGTNPLTAIPLAVTLPVVERGKERFDIYCAPCHGLTGDGNGMVVKRGLPKSPAFTTDRLESAPVGHFVDVIVRGYGVMLPQAAQVSPDDRWAIAAYVRALQLSQHAQINSLPRDDVAKLQTLP